MAVRRTVRRAVVGFGIVTAGALVAMHPGAVRAFYLDIYPEDPAKAQALTLCFAENHAFNRLDSSERDACYRHVLQSAGEVAAASMATANAVDLRRAAGQTGMPRNDVRRLEQTETLLHGAH